MTIGASIFLIALGAVLAFAVENCSVTRLDHLDGPSGSGWRIGTVNQQPWAGQRIKR